MSWSPKWLVEYDQLDPALCRISATNPAAKEVKERINPGKRYAYFLTHKAGNVLFHGPDYKRFYDLHSEFFDGLGGIAHHVYPRSGDLARV